MQGSKLPKQYKTVNKVSNKYMVVKYKIVDVKIQMMLQNMCNFTLKMDLLIYNS